MSSGMGQHMSKTGQLHGQSCMGWPKGRSTVRIYSALVRARTMSSSVSATRQPAKCSCLWPGSSKDLGRIGLSYSPLPALIILQDIDTASILTLGPLGSKMGS